MADEPTPRLWPALDVDVRQGAPADIADRVALVLDDCEATAVESDIDTHYRVYFAEPTSRDAAAELLARALSAFADVTPVDVPDEGWALKVQSTLGPIRVGTIVVAPPWSAPSEDPAPPQADDSAADAVLGPELRIVIEPSMGFGTGHHQSTRQCLLALQHAPLDDATVVDVGTGSGVLAIAAAMLGARAVVALDNDPDAVDAARDNVARNGVGDRVEVRNADVGTSALAPASVVVANLTAWTLRQHGTALASLVAPAGHLILSGFTHDQVGLVTDAFPAFHASGEYEEDGWVALRLRRRESAPVRDFRIVKP